MNNTAVSFDIPTPPRKGTRGGAGDHVYLVLREAIVSLELKPGQILDKQVFVERFGVSRAPIYDAFTRLQAEALVDVVPQRGTTVSLIKISDARENMFLRRAIEVEAVRAVTRNFSGGHLEALKQNLRYQSAAVASGDKAGFHRFDLEFHAVLFEALGFERVKAFAETARLGLDRVRRLLNSRRRQEFTLQEHQAILDEIQQRNANAAANAMAAHLDAVMKELETFAAANPELFADLQTKPDGQQ
jgi:DNA-binding GntR family transcriptional regulator